MQIAITLYMIRYMVYNLFDYKPYMANKYFIKRFFILCVTEVVFKIPTANCQTF